MNVALTRGVPRADLPAAGFHVDALTGKAYYGDGSAWWEVTRSPHAAQHVAGGSDSIKLDDLVVPDDNADLNVSTSRHGLVPKLPNDATKFLNGVGAYAVPAGSLVYSDGTVPGGNTVANTAAETAFASSYTIPANRLVAGTVARVRLFGTYGTTIIAPTLAVKFKLGSTVAISTGALTMVANLSSVGWMAEALLICAVAGSGGSIEAHGFAEFATAATAGLVVNLANTASVSLDTTAAHVLTVTAQWGTADADNTIKLRAATVEVM